MYNQGYDVHGRCRGKSGTCYVVASKRSSRDYGDKECRNFVAVNPNDIDAEWIRFKFSVSRTALSCKWVQELTGDAEQFLREAGLLRFRKLLAEDDSPGRSDEFMLQSSSSRDEFVMHDPAGLRLEVGRVKQEVLEFLWQNRHRGLKRTVKQAIEDMACTTSSVLDSALVSFEKRKLIEGAYGSSGVKITVGRELELDRLRDKDTERQRHAVPYHSAMKYDVFISHAPEDKTPFVRPLAQALQQARLKVWYDEFALRLGDSLRESIDRGLSTSRYGLVNLSHHFFSKTWPQPELNGLFATIKVENGESFRFGMRSQPKK
jgi:TIR domain